jgi:hypothetical protein
MPGCFRSCCVNATTRMVLLLLQKRKHSNLVAAFDYCRRPPLVLRSEGPGLAVMREVEAARIMSQEPMHSNDWTTFSQCKLSAAVYRSVNHTVKLCVCDGSM